MKNYFFIINALGIIFMILSTQASAAPFKLTPGSIVNAANCTNSNATVKNTVKSCSGQKSLTLLYKSKVGNSVDSGTYKNSYTTTYFKSPTDPKHAQITFDKSRLGPMDCMKTYSCWLSVKGGKSTPSVYVFSLVGWNGIMNINLRNFWSKKGAISNIQIYGGAPIAHTPIPAAVWLFGSGFIGFMSIARKIRIKA